MLTQLEVQGTLLKLTPKKLYLTRKAVNSVRGKITGFSKKARGRLIEKMARLDVSKQRTVFLTLTFSGLPSEAAAKAAFQRFRMRLTRLFPRMSAMWRKEYQARGAIHYHLICFNMGFWLQSAIQKSWEECTHEERSIVHIKLLRHSRQAMYYVAKYIAKQIETGEFPSLDDVPYLNNAAKMETGRHWGYLRAACLPYAKKRRALLLDAQVEGYLRFAIRGLSRGRASRAGGSVKLYSEDAHEVFRLAVEWGGFYVDTDNFGSFGAVLGGVHPSSYLAALYAVRGSTYNRRSEANRAYSIFARRWLDNQRLAKYWGRGSNKKRGTFAKIIFPC